MLHGSGPLDRNENMKGQQLNIFNHLAQALADAGIASLRYDKRGCGNTTGEFMSAGHSDLLADASYCLQWLAECDQVSTDKLFILGHSEGCIIAPQLAQQQPSLAGLVLLCPFMEDMESVLLRQAAQLEQEIASLRGVSGFLYGLMGKVFGSPTALQRRLIEKVRASKVDVIRTGLKRFPAKWLRELLALDPAAIFSATHTPMLLIGGEKDLQCNPDDIYRIAETAPGQSETLLIENMTHLLRKDAEPATILGSMQFADQPVSGELTAKTIQWIQSLPAASNPAQQAANSNFADSKSQSN
ncbi:MAG: alpha/beta hydrolase [Pseudomonadales bacterium]|nr:alpha/beta hydrolase [Pseudomonadales bacterium]